MFDADPLGVQRVHGVLGVDERAHAAELLGLGDHVVDERRLARGLRAEDLDDAAARHAADAEREVERERAGRDRRDPHLRALVAHAHDRALAELALDLRQRPLQGGVAGLGFMGAHMTSDVGRWHRTEIDTSLQDKALVRQSPAGDSGQGAVRRDPARARGGRSARTGRRSDAGARRTA